MNHKLIRFSRRYAAVLREHLSQGPRASLQPARGLGRQAVNLGLEALDLARMHEGALATLEASSRQAEGITQAQTFFIEALTAVERTHGAALELQARLHQANQALDRRTEELANSTRALEKSVIRRKSTEQALKTSGGHYQKLLEESRGLQQHLRELAQQILRTQENKRKSMSHDLQDEISQALLGINARVLTLKKVAAHNEQGLRREIASAERLVEDSMHSIKRFAREFRKRHEA